MGSQKKKLKNMDETVPVIPVLGIQKASILALDIQGTSSSASSGLSSSKKPAVGLSQWVQNSPFAPLNALIINTPEWAMGYNMV
jgi:hypothetical protein